MSGGGLVDPRYAGDGDYAQVIADIAETGVCPFCPENFRWHPHKIESRSEDWLITMSARPYENTEYHFVIIPNRHIVDVVDLKPADWKQISSLVSHIRLKYEIVGGALACRFGPTSHTGATVQHLHCHFIVPEIDPETGCARTVVFPIG